MADWKQEQFDARGGADQVGPELPRVLRVAEVRRESPQMVTLLFERPAEGGPDLQSCSPGQFYMLWLPGRDEKPYALSHLDESRVGVTVMERGPFSERLCALEPGAKVGFRGPYGRGFTEVDDPDRTAAVGGGCGLAALALLKERNTGLTLVQGAPSEEHLLWRDRFTEQVPFTEDGSGGRKGLPTDWLRAKLRDGELDRVYTCGPEPMMAEVVRLCRGADVRCEGSLERYMKCGIGVCGSCECSGWLVCRDGPVFTGEELAGMPDFGRAVRTGSGRKVPAENRHCEP
ncbi:MAG: dihydroorotate dehydrogenase electron transfer subunit [Planctomycetota bacterium]